MLRLFINDIIPIIRNIYSAILVLIVIRPEPYVINERKFMKIKKMVTAKQGTVLKKQSILLILRIFSFFATSTNPSITAITSIAIFINNGGDSSMFDLVAPFIGKIDIIDPKSMITSPNGRNKNIQQNNANIKY